jgi:molybdopterin molybdotransferase
MAATPPIRYSEAAEVLRQAIVGSRTVSPAPPETVPLTAAASRVLAEPIRADRDQPPFPRSTRDGFACRAAEANTHQFLLLAAHLRAGEDPAAIASGHVAPGELWEIMTGAPVPAGADAVFMVEHAEFSANPESAAIHNEVYAPDTHFVRLAAPRSLASGENIVAAGSEARSGDLVVPKGTRLTAAHIALAAQCGYPQLSVLARPTVAILSTGDELVSVESTPGPSQIRNSNSAMLAVLVAAAGGMPLTLSAVPDDTEPLAAAIHQALEADLMLVTGGISAGRFDLVDEILGAAGATFLFRGVSIQPGKPVAFGQIPRPDRSPLPFFALPGNPISSAVTFQLFAAPLLAALAGDSGPNPRFAQAQLATPWRGKPGLTRFLPAYCDFGRPARVEIIPWQGSGDLAAFARSNCFAVIPDDATEISAGASMQILLVD